MEAPGLLDRPRSAFNAMRTKEEQKVKAAGGNERPESEFDLAAKACMAGTSPAMTSQ
jgi:hypothetical protein